MGNVIDRKYISVDEHKKLLVDLLLELDHFCCENNIKYYLYAGTLLGAVRHAGFIPWDDDIDVCMLRSEYEFFLKSYCSRDGKYNLVSISNDKTYFYPYAKLINTETVLIENKEDSINLGVYLDVFPLDDCPGETLGKACKSVDNMNFLRCMRNLKIVGFSKERRFYKNFLLMVGKICALPFSQMWLSRRITYKATRNTNSNAKYIAQLVYTIYGHGEVFERSWFGEGKELTFEKYKFSVPKNYDKVLKAMYGDYMKLPPVEKRISHHDYVCWYK